MDPAVSGTGANTFSGKAFLGVSTHTGVCGTADGRTGTRGEEDLHSPFSGPDRTHRGRGGGCEGTVLRRTSYRNRLRSAAPTCEY